MTIIRKARRARASDLDRAVGARLRRHRLLLGLSQETLGKSIGVSFQAIQKYETGENRLSAGRLAALARRMELPISIFFDEAEQPAKRAPSDTALLMAGKIDRLAPHQQAAVRRLVDVLSTCGQAVLETPTEASP